MLTEFRFSAALTLLALLLVFVLSANVGRARVRYGVKAPATDGSPDFARVFRVQQNTLEQFLFFLPALWLCAAGIGDAWAALLGLPWLVGRLVYARAYYRDAAKRGPGFTITILSSVGLWFGAVIGLILSLA
jgi:uncharacterized MAPEG superfamily protein